MHSAPDSPSPLWRAAVAVPALAVVTLLTALIATSEAGVPLRDPKGVTLARLLVATGLVLAVAAVDLLVRRRRGGGPRWTRGRVLAVAAAVVGFFVTYGAYRNLKSIVPLLRPGDLFDRQLTDLDRGVLGTDPAVLLHDLLGTGAAAHVLSGVYMFFFLFIPITLALALVLLADPRAGLLYATALAANWPLAAASYFVLPSIGPFHVDPAAFAALPTTAVTDLQTLLVDERVAFLRDPSTPGAAQSIGAFASLHVSICVTAALATHLLGLPRPVRVAAWAFAGLTVLATVYFGWHYLSDDVCGVAIAVAAVLLARRATGYDPRAARTPRAAATTPAPAPAATPEPA